MKGLHWRSIGLTVALVGTVAATGCGSGQSDDDADQSIQARQNARNSDIAEGRNKAPDGQDLVPELPDFTDLVKKASPSVVNISARPRHETSTDQSQGQPEDKAPDHSRGDSPLNQWLNQFFDQGPGDPDEQADPREAEPETQPSPDGSAQESLGSGVIISSDGYILTSRHVVADTDEITVKLNDRRQLDAKVVGEDEGSDMALLKIKAEDLPVARLGSVDDLGAGSWVVAIGSPYGFETSVAAGIISAKGRHLADSHYVPYLQTDVAINPGNSGGPLFNRAGEVVGINSQIFSDTGGSQGISFAVPIDVAMKIAEQLRHDGHVTRGWLGVQVQSIDRDMARNFDLDRAEGALVTHVIPDGPADQSRLKSGDVIVAVNDRTIDDASALPSQVAPLEVGEKARVKWVRKGHEHTEEIKIAALPEQYDSAESADDKAEDETRHYGLKLDTLDKSARRQLGVDNGVRIEDIAPGPAADAGLQPDDIIISVDTTDVDSPHAMLEALNEADGSAALLVMRDGVRRYLSLQKEDTGD